MKMPLDLTGMSGEKSNTITLMDNSALTYVDYLLLLLQNQAHDLRNERPLMKSQEEVVKFTLLISFRIPSNPPRRQILNAA